MLPQRMKQQGGLGGIPPAQLWGTGLNTNGQLGNGTAASRSSPVQVGANEWIDVSSGTVTNVAGNGHSLGVKTNGTLWSWGMGSLGKLGRSNTTATSSPAQIGSLSSWRRVGAGYYHSIALKQDGTIWTWGGNTLGQLGLNFALGSHVSSPVQIGSSRWSQISVAGYQSFGVRTDGSLWAWGAGVQGQMGQSENIHRSAPVQISSTSRWRSVFSGGAIALAFAIRDDGSLWAWGRNSTGGLGNNASTDRSLPVQIGTGTDWKSVAIGGAHTVALKNDGTLWTWGSGAQGQLGHNGTASRSSPTLVSGGNYWLQIGATNASSFAIKSDGTLWAWGYGTLGILGRNNTTSISSPAQVGSGTSWWDIKTTGGNHATFMRLP